MSDRSSVSDLIRRYSSDSPESPESSEFMGEGMAPPTFDDLADRHRRVEAIRTEEMLAYLQQFREFELTGQYGDDADDPMQIMGQDRKLGQVLMDGNEKDLDRALDLEDEIDEDALGVHMVVVDGTEVGKVRSFKKDILSTTEVKKVRISRISLTGPGRGGRAISFRFKRGLWTNAR